ncbi:MAG: tetratricopeptide repeat protein [Planctomycetes bacterium]|nr:tetratricopeptide repeat protein [Planctomycetota bacterium]MCL4731372.1 tetratricopeptide repeat protein [Planctomycetota bacterium]
MGAPAAEQAYLFRHALLRDAAYQLLPPAQRADLHSLALGALESAVPEGGRAEIALELAEHARLADNPDFAPRELRYLGLASRGALDSFRLEQARVLCARIAAHPAASQSDREQAVCSLAESQWLDGRLAEAVHSCETALGGLPAPQAAARARLHTLACKALREQGRHDAALAHARAAEPAAVAAGDADLSARVALDIASSLRGHAAPEQVRHALDHAAALAANLPRNNILRRVLSQYALHWADVGDLARARETAEQVVALHRAAGDRFGLAADLCVLAFALARGGNLARATTIYREAIAALRANGQLRRAQIELANLASLLLDTGQLMEAEATLNEALAVIHETGTLGHEGMVLGNLGSAARRRGNLERARELFTAALGCARRDGMRAFEGHCLAYLAEVADNAGQLDEAERGYAAAAEVLEQAGDRLLFHIVRANLAIVWTRTGRLAEAESTLRAAVDFLRAQGESRFLPWAMAQLAVCLLRAGNREAALEMRRQCLPDLEPRDRAELDAAFGQPV